MVLKSGNPENDEEHRILIISQVILSISYPLNVGTIHSNLKWVNPPFFLSSRWRYPSAHNVVLNPAAIGW